MQGKDHCVVFFPILIFLCSTAFAVTDTPSVFTRAEALFADSQYMSALETYRDCIIGKRFHFRQHNDDDAKAFYKIGLCYYRTTNYLAAGAAFEEYMRLYPADAHFADALLYCANAYEASGDYKNASEEWYRAWLRGVASGDRQTPLFYSARCAEKDGNEQRAAAIYTEFLQKFPSDRRVGVAAPACVVMLIKQKKLYAAAAIVDAVEKQRPKDDGLLSKLLYVKALLAKAQLKNETARRFYSALVNRTDDFPEKQQALEDYASLLAADGHYTTLLHVYKKMADLRQSEGRTPLPWNFLMTWARVASSAGSFDMAEKLLRQMLDTYRGSDQTAQVVFELAQCQLAKKDSGSALSSLQEIMSGPYSDSLRGMAAIAAAGIYALQGLYPQAIAAYRAYCSLPGRGGADSIQYTIARIYQDKGLYATAIQEYDRLVRLYPQSPWYFRAVLNAGRCEEAMSHFQAALDRYSYASESDAPLDIIETAKKLKDNVQRFGVADIDAGIVELERMAQKSAEGAIAPWERLMRMAEVFENMLHDFPAALDLYDQVSRCAVAPPDSIAARIVYCKALVWEKMYRKARFDRDSVRYAALKGKALTLLQEASRCQRFPSVADDAQFRMMMLGTPSINELERYLGKNPSAGHADEALMQIGDYYEKRANADGKSARKAIDAFSRVARSACERYRSRALLSLSRLWYASGGLDSAGAAVNELTRRYPDSACMVEGLYLAALIEKSRGNYPLSIIALKNLISTHPFGEFAQRARFDLAQAQLASGCFPEALRDYRTYVQSYPGGQSVVDARFGIAQCQARMGKTEDAGGLLYELLKEKCPPALIGSIYCELSQYCKAKGDVQAALEYLQKAISIDSFPEKGVAYARMGDLYFENSLYADAAGAFVRFMQYARTQSDSMEGIIGIITSQTMDGQEASAEKSDVIFKKRFGSRHPRYGEVAYYQGLRALVDKKYETAIKKFKTIAETFGGSEYCGDAAYQIGLCYYYMGKQEKAFEVFHDCIAQYPGSRLAAMANFKIGMMLHDRGDFSPAAEVFEKVAADPAGDKKTRFRAACNAAVDFQKSSSWLDAARQYLVIIDSFPQEVAESSTFLKIGFCYIQGSHFEDAFKYFQKAAGGASPEEKPEIIYWTAQCWERLGDHQKAITEYLKVPAQFPTMGQWALTSQFEAARLCEHMGDMKKAVELYRKIIASDGEKGVFGKEASAQCARLNPFVKDN